MSSWACKKAGCVRSNVYFFHKRDRSGVSRTAITLNFKLHAIELKGSTETDINLDPLMPDEDENFRGSLVLDIGI